MAIRQPARSAADRGLGVARHGEHQRAGAEAERQHGVQGAAVLGNEVGAGQAQLDEAVGDVLGDVLGAHEEELDVGVPDGRAQPALGELELEPGIAQQLDRRLREPSLVREPRGATGVRHRRRRRDRACRSSTSR